MSVAGTERSALLEVSGLEVHFPIKRGLVIDRTVGYVRAVDGVDLLVPRGQTFGLVGESGCGKSTVFRLLFRFYEPSRGRILVDGQDVRSLQLASLRRAIGVVPQDTPLFHSDVLHNIRYGRLDASDAEVVEAARKAHVHEAVLRLPEKYETKVGERGLMLSGGEKQRLAVARVLLKDPPILFFDEAVRVAFARCVLAVGGEEC